MQGASERAQVARIKSVVPSLAITFYSGSLSGDPPDLRRFIAPDCNFGSAKIGVARSLAASESEWRSANSASILNWWKTLVSVGVWDHSNMMSELR